MHRFTILILGFAGLLAFAVAARAQNPADYVQWGEGVSYSATDGVLNAGLIPTTTGSNSVRYSNVNGQGYDIVVTTKGLTQAGDGTMPWNGIPAWWYEGATASKAGDSIPYSTISFYFYAQGTNLPFGVTGVNFTFQNAKIGERYRAFSYFDTVGNQVPLSFTNYSVFSYALGYPDLHVSDSSVDTGIPYVPGNFEGDWIGVDMAPLAISGFTFQTGRVDSFYGSNFMTALGYLVPTDQLLIVSGANLNVTAGPTFVSTGSDAVLTPASLTGTLGGANAAVLSGSGISQNIVIEQNIVSGSGNSLTMVASQNLLSASSEISLTSTTGNAGSISLTGDVQSVLVNHLEAGATTGTGGSITIFAGNNIGVTGGIDTSATGLSGSGGAISLDAGNAVTANTVRSGGGGGVARLGAPGDIAVTATNSVSIGALYDDSGPGYSPLVTIDAPYISIGQSGSNGTDITGTLEMEYPPSDGAGYVSIIGNITGSGGVVVSTGSGVASLFSNVAYTGETDVLSGVLSAQQYSLPSSALVLDGSSAFYPGVESPGGYVAVNALTVGTDATLNITLTGTATYDVVQVANAANLNGIFNLTVAGGFTPAIGQVFQVLTSATTNGQFASYQGLRLTSCVLEPVYTGASMLLVTSTIPTGASQPLQTVPPGGLGVSAGGYYNGLTTSLQIDDPFTLSATLIDGTASADTTVSMSLAASGAADYELQGSLGESILSLLGTGTDKVVVQLDYNQAAALAAAGDQRQLFLASTSGAAPFANAVLANTDLPGEPNNPTEFLRAYNPATDFHLGYYGVDTIDNRVWAVVDYDAYFGLGAQDVSASPAGPAAATEPAGGVLSESATFNGLVNYNGYDTMAVFESGTVPSMAGSSLTPCVASGDAPGFIQVCYPAMGLTPMTTYYYRVDALTTSGTEYGGILSFTTPPSGLYVWRNTYFATYSGTGAAADTADPANDGIPNLVKYATGMSPLVASSSPAAAIGHVTTGSGTYLTLTFNEIADPTLTYCVQASGSIAGPWTGIWSSSGTGNTAGSVTVQDTVPVGRQPGRFLRLQISD